MIRPERVSPDRTALLLIDMQVDFGAADGAMARQGKDMTAIPAALANAVLLADAARAAGVPLIFVRLLGPPEGGLCVKGAHGADFIGPKPQAGDVIISKSRFSAFANTGLAEQLRQRGIDTVVLAGLTTECCIQASAWAAFELDFQVVLVADACAAYEEEEGLHRHALKALELNGAVLGTAREFVSFWKNAI